MKRMLIGVLLVLTMTSWALATPYFAATPVKEHYMPSDWITINLVNPSGDLPVIGIMFDAIVDVICPGGASAGGVAAEPQVFNVNFGTTMPGALNAHGMLVEYMFANDTTLPARGAVGILYSFQYHVPDVPASTLICIESYSDGYDWYDPLISYKDGTTYEGPIEMLECIHVIPEPATMLLLGLGGLLLRRRK